MGLLRDARSGFMENATMKIIGRAIDYRSHLCEETPEKDV